VKQLSGIDAAFLGMETATQFGHVSSVVFVDPTAGGTGNVYRDLRAAFEERLHLLGVYRRKLAEVPLGLDHPYWVDDPDLDLNYHLREIGLPRPGNERQLAEQVARITARPLDRSRPLWEWYVISGLEDGQVAILTKIHHATIDGVSGVELLQILFDTEAGGRDLERPAEQLRPARPPTPPELLARTMFVYATRPRKALQLQIRLLRTAATLSRNPAFRGAVGAMVPGLRRLARVGGEAGEERLELPNRVAPRTPFNRAVTPHRRFAYKTLRLSHAQTVKRALGVTVNDVVMAICGAALRRYLLDRDTLPPESLVAMVPVSVRTGGEGELGSNRVTGMLCALHTDVADPVARLRAIHESMASAKELQRAVPADILSDITQFAPPALVARAARLSSGVRLADRLNPPFNLTISNVPGPRQPLYLAGTPMTHFYPVSVVADGQGLNMTVQSYLDNLDFGLVSCRELVPDLWDLAGHVGDALDELVEAAAQL